MTENANVQTGDDYGLNDEEKIRLPEIENELSLLFPMHSAPRFICIKSDGMIRFAPKTKPTNYFFEISSEEYLSLPINRIREKAEEQMRPF